MFKQKDHEIGRNKGSKIPCPDTQGFFQTVAQRYIGGFFVIKLSICPLGILRSKWWAFFE